MADPPRQHAQQPAQQRRGDSPRDDDDVSSLGGEEADGDSLASLRSSILEYRRENGRTYHKLSDGKYHFPNDEREQERLDFSHQAWMVTWEGELCNSPMKHGAKRVLDVGTGTGIWAMDYADEHPEATVLGVDLSPIQPGYVPPNCHFEVDDLEKEWTWSLPFDFIFVRTMVASFADWPAQIAKFYDNLEPGGYLEINENDFPVFCDDGTMPEDSAVLKWTNLLIETTDKIGRPITVVPQFKQMLEDAGFEDVEVKKAKWPISPWAKDPGMKDMGVWVESGIMQGAEAISLGLFTRVLDWSKEETLVFCANVRNEVKKQKVHAYFDVYSVWGRKPLKAEESTAP